MQSIADPAINANDLSNPAPSPRAFRSTSSTSGIGAATTNLAISILCVGLVACLIKSTCKHTAWGYQFLFNRRFVQWIIVWMCVHGLVEAVRRLPVWWRERRALREWQRGGVPDASAGLVAERYQRVRTLLDCSAVTDLRAGARRLSEEAAAQLDARYSTINLLTHLASYCGFFGTVLGLSVGLFQAFGSAGALSLKSFGGAVSTSFDTTLSGVACTILLIMVQSFVRSREEAVLSATDQLVEDTVLHHEQEAAASLGVSGLAISPQNYAELYSHTVDIIAGQVREVTNASQSLAQQTRLLIETLEQTNGDLRATFNEVTATHRRVETAEAGIHKGLTQIADVAKAQTGQIAAAAAHAGQLESRIAELKEVCSRRRILTVTEAV